MIGNILGAVIGRQIDRRDGEGGLKGALIGAVIPALVRRALPLAILAGGAFAVKAALDKRRGGGSLTD